MISAVFFSRQGEPSGFSLSGHSGFAPSGEDIVCAAASSAAYMAANTISEIIGCRVSAEVCEGAMRVELQSHNKQASDIIRGLRLHLEQLAEQYPQNIKITSEV